MRKRLAAGSLGILLLVAAGLKLYGLNVAPFAQYGRLTHASMQLAAVEWEILLGLWLLSGYRPVGAWIGALATFCTFAGVSLYLGVIGQASCGCFGSLRATPWHTFVVDLVALIILLFGRPDRCNLRLFDLAGWKTTAWRGLTVALVGVAIIGLGTFFFGSVDAALAHLRGERVSLRPGFVDLGRGKVGESLEATIEVVNRTDRPVRVLGGTSDCSCVVTGDLPLTLAPGEVRHVSVHVRLPGTPGFFNRKAFLWTDCPQARRILFSLAGRFDPPAPASASARNE